MSVESQQLNKLLLEAKELLKQQEYEQAQNAIKQLHEAVELLFSSESFDKNLFLSSREENLSLKTTLLEIDAFFQREVKSLTLSSKQVVEELSSLKAANKMKKAYGA